MDFHNQLMKISLNNLIGSEILKHKTLSEEEILIKFEKAIKYKRLGFLMFIIAITFIAFIEHTFLRYFLGILFIFIGIFLERQYKCPICKKVFDPRIKSKDITYCSNCGSSIQ